MRIRDYICRAIPFLYPMFRTPIHWVRWAVQSCGEIQRVSHNYEIVLSRVRKSVISGRKIKVLFLFNENSKWKCQKLYELMDKSSYFEPKIALTKADVDWGLTQSEFETKYRENIEFCRRHCLQYVEAYSLFKDEAVDLSLFSPDIVFYQHPWIWPKIQEPQVVSRYALTCYVPYYVLCYDEPMSDSQQFLHRFVYRYFLLNQKWVDYFLSKRHGLKISGEWISSGHPVLDLYSDLRNEKCELVIYAPHWSIPNKKKDSANYSTFLSTGEYILEYAKNHPEIKWCFKPHPTLRGTLKHRVEWSVERINAYYEAWEKVGLTCYTGDYPDLFAKSRALITDCSSFLMEYSALNKPLVYLVSGKNRNKFAKANMPLVETFYQARNLSELENVLDRVILKQQDPHALRRSQIIAELGIAKSNASEVILQHLVNLLTK